MDRRELIKYITLLTGATVAGSELFLSGCKNNDKIMAGQFSEKDIAFFDEVAETIIPRTNTPGAKDAGVGKFMASYSTDCYDKEQLKRLKAGINQLNKAAEKKNSDEVMRL